MTITLPNELALKLRALAAKANLGREQLSGEKYAIQILEEFIREHRSGKYVRPECEYDERHPEEPV